MSKPNLAPFGFSSPSLGVARSARWLRFVLFGTTESRALPKDAARHMPCHPESPRFSSRAEVEEPSGRLSPLPKSRAKSRELRRILNEFVGRCAVEEQLDDGPGRETLSVKSRLWRARDQDLWLCSVDAESIFKAVPRI